MQELNDLAAQKGRISKIEGRTHYYLYFENGNLNIKTETYPQFRFSEIKSHPLAALLEWSNRTGVTTKLELTGNANGTLTQTLLTLTNSNTISESEPVTIADPTKSANNLLVRFIAFAKTLPDEGQGW